MVINKQDLNQQSQQELLDLLPDARIVHVSASTGAGIDEVERELHGNLASDVGVQPSLVNARQRSALDRAYAHVTDAMAAHEAAVPQDLLATSVRAALHAVGEVTGENVDEAVLVPFYYGFHLGMNVDADTVYRMLEVVEENIDEIVSSDPGLSQLQEDLVGMQVRGIESVGDAARIHPGLARFLKDRDAWNDDWDDRVAG